MVSTAHAGRCWVVLQHLPLTHATEESSCCIVPNTIQSEEPGHRQSLPELPCNPAGSLVTSTTCLETVPAPCPGLTGAEWGEMQRPGSGTRQVLVVVSSSFPKITYPQGKLQHCKVTPSPSAGWMHVLAGACSQHPRSPPGRLSQYVQPVTLPHHCGRWYLIYYLFRRNS